MNLDEVIAASETRHTPVKKVEPPKTVFIAPYTEDLPDDGVLSYTTIESVYDLKSIPDRSVVMLRDDQTALMKCVADNRALFALELVTLTGLPAANYSASFDEVTWAFNKVAYAPFISELRLASEIADQLDSQNKTPYAREKEAYTRKTGEVKQMTAFDVSPVDSDPEDSGFGDVESLEL